LQPAGLMVLDGGGEGLRNGRHNVDFVETRVAVRRLVVCPGRFRQGPVKQ
jgi:hypothetical protein